MFDVYICIILWKTIIEAKAARGGGGRTGTYTGCINGA